MVRLYFDPTCFYCQRVLRHLREHHIEFEPHELDVWVDTPARRELVELGGRTRVPFLVDPEADVKMYESADIVEYLKRSHPA